MPIRQTSDSLSRCDPNLYSTIYDVRKRTDIQMQEASPTQPVHKDTLEISHDKLKKEALNRLRHTSKFLIFQNSFMRIGKYLFLAVAFPPYLVVYGIPKWIIMEGLPALMTVCMTVAEKIKQKVKKRAEVVSQKIRQTVQTIQQMVQTLIRPIVRLMLDIRQAFHRMRHTTQAVFKRLTESVKAVIKRPGTKIAELAKRLQKGTERIQKWATERTSAVVHQFQEALARIKQIPQMGLAWGNVQFEKIADRAKAVGMKWQVKFHTSQSAARAATEWLSKWLGQAGQKAAGILAPIKHFYVNGLKPIWQEASRFVQAGISRSKDFFSRKRQQALHILQQGQERLKGLTFQQVSDWLTPRSSFTGWLGKLQQAIGKLFTHSLIQLFLKGIFSFCSALLLRFLQLLSFLIKGASKGLQIFFEGKRQLLQLIKKTFQTGKDYVKVGMQIGRKWTKKGTYSFLLFLTMAGIIGLWGIQWLGESLQTLTSNYLFRKRGIQTIEK
ncbi:hypothetical protein [Candidatus Protochlamydia phocaeensis]|uniref:hypothetical protein n=1 Tax=Candidatus Protochlamydia phocaeensis TaxID=1414722 RepID=UPI0008399CC8|nr:hypothetical protein [Candidatus Protochlamydia phocaeensis]